jgi:RING finger protein 121
MSLIVGTLGRDFVDRLSDKMAQTVGFYSKQGFPTRQMSSHSNLCAICGDATGDYFLIVMI